MHAHTQGYPAIFLPAECNKPEIICVLAKLGADLNENIGGYTPLGVAAEKGNLEAAKALVESGGDVNIPQIHGTALIIAAQRGRHEMMRLLIELGADMNTRRPTDGMTAVLVAAFWGHEKAVRMLYKLGADMKCENCLNISAWAELGGHSKVTEMLEKVMNKLSNECDFCGGCSKRVKACGRCLKVHYCSRECQLEDFKAHKRVCKKLVQQQQLDTGAAVENA